MDAKKCDFCGKLYEIYNSIEEQRWNSICLFLDNYKMSYFDICPDCHQAFIEFMNNRKYERELSND